METLPNWVYTDNTEVSSAMPGVYGFIYKITYEDGTYYYGKKNLYRTLKLPALKSGKQRPNSKRIGKNENGKRVYYDLVTKESDWKSYKGSNDVETPIVRREILEYARSKRELTYLEVKWLFKMDALEDVNCLNKNINNLWFRGNLV